MSCIRKFFLIMVFASTAGVAAQSEAWLIEIQKGWAGSQAILLTGFGPFGGVSDNPSGRIIKTFHSEIDRLCGDSLSDVKSHKLPVNPGVISKFDLSNYHTIVNVGVASGSSEIRLERWARNRYTDPDTGLSTPIDSRKPLDYLVEGALAPTNLLPSYLGFKLSLGNEYSAGTYVCNDTYYRVSSTTRNGYFIHIPNIKKNRDKELSIALAQLSCQIFEYRR